MSIYLNIPVEFGELVNTHIEITREGEISFPDHDIEYDRAMVEFGEPKTPAVRVFERWRSTPGVVIATTDSIDSEIMTLIACDWAEHVLPYLRMIDTGSISYDVYPITAIEAVRKYVRNDSVDRNKITSMERTIANMKVYYDEYAIRDDYELSKQNALEAAEDALRSVEYCLSAAKSLIWKERRRNRHRAVSRTSSIARGHAVVAASGIKTFDPREKEIFLRGKAEEQLWQVRRFFDVFKALEAGLPWPELGVTE